MLDFYKKLHNRGAHLDKVDSEERLELDIGRIAVQGDVDRVELAEDLRALFYYRHDQTLHNEGTHLDRADFVVHLELGIGRIVALVDVDRAELVEDLKSYLI